MDWMWGDQMQVYSLDSCPVIRRMGWDSDQGSGGEDAQEKMATCEDFSI